MSIVEIVRRAYRYVMDPICQRATPQLLDVAVKSLYFSEKPHAKVIVIQQTDRVVLIYRGNKPAPDIPYCFQVTRSDVAANAYHCKVALHIIQAPFQMEYRCPRSHRG